MVNRGEQLKSQRWAAQVRIVEGSHWSRAVPVTTFVRPTNFGLSRFRHASGTMTGADTRAGLCELRGVKKCIVERFLSAGVHDRLKQSRVTKG
jgi:hypothetical protein